MTKRMNAFVVLRCKYLKSLNIWGKILDVGDSINRYKRNCMELDMANSSATEEDDCRHQNFVQSNDEETY